MKANSTLSHFALSYVYTLAFSQPSRQPHAPHPARKNFRISIGILDIAIALPIDGLVVS